MARKYRIAAISALVVAALVVAIGGGAYYAARQVRPFYEQALKIEPAVLERGSREMETRASALYTDVKQIGHWKALFTAEQINGWLATQLAADKDGKTLADMRDLRIAIARDCLTLGFRYKSAGVDTVVSIDASVLITDDGSIAIRFLSVRAGALPLPVMKAADMLATNCQKLKLPVRWTQEQGHPIAIINIASNASLENREFFIDTIELRNGEMYLAGHTEVGSGLARKPTSVAKASHKGKKDFALDDYELRLTPSDEHAALEIARRSSDSAAENDDSTTR